LEANVPRTIENTRDFNQTIISAPNTHAGPGPSAAVAQSMAQNDDDAAEGSGDAGQGQAEEAAGDEDEDEDPHAPPALLITTSLPSNNTTPHLVSANARSKPGERTRAFVDELLNIFPGAEYRPRSKAKGAGLGKISGWARGRGYGGMLVIGEDKKAPVSLTIVGLPHGPTAFFRLTSLSIGSEIYGHARPTPHTPELILNNFTTSLGHSIGGLLQSLFPRVPELAGRQVITAHNQRDFIFFRRHRYMFKSTDKTALQEIGPRFTIKLRSLKEGLPKGAGVWDGQVNFDGVPEETKDEEQAQEELDEAAEGSGAAAAQSATGMRKRKPETGRAAEEDKGLEFEWKVSTCAPSCCSKQKLTTRLLSRAWASLGAASTCDLLLCACRTWQRLYTILCDACI
jgi:ribosome production factor 1